MRPPDRLRAVAALVPLLLAAACDDAPTRVQDPSGGRPITIASVTCRVQVRSGSVACGTPASGASQDLIVGGQGLYVQVTSGAPNYSGTTFTFPITVGNLIDQAMGTADGTTPDVNGVRVFFDQMPTATSGAGTITVASDGTDVFTAPGQHFFQYSGAELGADGILSPGETSAAQTWSFDVPATVLTFEFRLYVAAEVPFPDGYIEVSPAVDSLLAGSSQLLTGTVKTAVGNTVPGQAISWGTSDAAVATVDASGNVTGVATGGVTITATSGARSGSATLAVCPDLAVGEADSLTMPVGSSFCLGGGGSGREYVVVPMNFSRAANASLTLTGTNIVPVSGVPTPSVLPSAPRFSAASSARMREPQPDLAWESALRRRERTELPRHAGRVSTGRAGTGPRLAITPGVPAVGALMTLNVETDNPCSTFDNRTGRVVAIGTHIIVMADTLNPAGGLSASDYAAIADSFDAYIRPVVTGAYGTPSDIDGNGRVIAFYTRAVNEMTPAGSSSFVGGFVFARDLYSAASCPTSNLGEMFYMLAADPTGEVNGNVRSVSFVLSKTYGTLGHEFEHLINASRRMHVNTPWNGQFEQSWLDEGLAHIAEELIFYNRSGTGPDANIGVAQLGDPAIQNAFFNHAESNFGRLRQWLLSPHTQGGFDTSDDLATRGATWSFLRYAADRKGGVENAFWSSLVNTGLTGTDNVDAAVGTDGASWFRDYLIAMYTDDAGLGAPAVYTNPSWNFREIYSNLDYNPGPGCSCAYELAPRNPASGAGDAFTVSLGGAAAYARMGVAAGNFAGVTVLSGGVTPPSTVEVAVIRRK